MSDMNDPKLHISKASFMMGAWGIVLLVASSVNHWFSPPNTDWVLLLWGVATLLGTLAQVVSLVKGLGLNLAAWIVVLVIGWLFTLFVVKYDNGSHLDLFGDMAGVWLILLGIGYIATAFQVDKLFFIMAAVHLLSGALLELSARRVVTIDFLDANSTLLFGIFSGLPLIIAALPFWYAPAAQTQSNTAYSR